MCDKFPVGFNGSYSTLNVSITAIFCGGFIEDVLYSLRIDGRVKGVAAATKDSKFGEKRRGRRERSEKKKRDGKGRERKRKHKLAHVCNTPSLI